MYMYICRCMCCTALCTWVHLVYLYVLQVYKSAVGHLLPTPAKSHYTFNLRDFARVVQGVMLVSPAGVENKRTFIRLWNHEVYRVFYDRLIDSADRTWLYSLTTELVKSTFKDSFKDVFSHLASQGGKPTEDDMRSLMFGDFMKPDTVRDLCRHC